jgi:hypothetical protein
LLLPSRIRRQPESALRDGHTTLWRSKKLVLPPPSSLEGVLNVVQVVVGAARHQYSKAIWRRGGGGGGGCRVAGSRCGVQEQRQGVTICEPAPAPARRREGRRSSCRVLVWRAALPWRRRLRRRHAPAARLSAGGAVQAPAVQDVARGTGDVVPIEEDCERTGRRSVDVHRRLGKVGWRLRELARAVWQPWLSGAPHP